MNSRLEALKTILERLIAERREKGISSRNLDNTYCVILGIAKSLGCEDSEEAEEILVELLKRNDEVIKNLAFWALCRAKNEEKPLDCKTHKALEQFENNPINQEICYHVDAALKEEKAYLN